jgi:hypothetical protein|tara:strand:- start:244 stop:567 length:324 start_codon:yes stop_codon:yes gene_type:complete
LRHRNSLNRAFNFQSADSDFQLTGFNSSNDIGDGLDRVRRLEQVHNRSRLRVSSLQPFALRGNNLRRKRIRVGFDEQVTRVWRCDFTNIKLFVERFADAVEDAKGSL